MPFGGSRQSEEESRTASETAPGDASGGDRDQAPHEAARIDPDDEILHDVAGLTSPMGDYIRAMTVLQLVDLLAYLASLEP